MKISKMKILGAAMLAGVTFGAPAAHATLLLEFSYNGGPLTAAPFLTGNASSSTATFGGTVGGVVISSGQITTNSPGTAALGTVTGGTFGIQNTGSTSQTLMVVLGSSGFTSPSNPGLLLASIGITDNGTLGTALGSVVSEYACAFSNSGAPTNCPTSGTFAKTATNTVTDTTTSASFSGTSSVNAAGMTTPYEIVDVISLTLAPGANFALTTAASVQVPEPVSVALLGFGLLGLATFARRRSNTQA